MNRKKWNRADILILAIYGLVAFIFLNILDAQNLSDKGKRLHAFIYTIFEYSAFAYLIRANLTSSSLKKSIHFISLAFIVFQIVSFKVMPAQKLDSVSIGIETLLIFIFIFSFFYENLRSSTNDYIYKNHCFWIVVGILIYLGSAFFIYILANHIEYKVLEQYWDYTYIGEIIKNILFSVAVFSYNGKRQKSTFASSHIPYLDMN